LLPKAARFVKKRSLVAKRCPQFHDLMRDFINFMPEFHDLMRDFINFMPEFDDLTRSSMIC
jgi:hypothetical protein